MRKLFNPFLALAAVIFVTAPVVIARAPFESTMGLVQKIFYYHMPAAMMMLLSAIFCGLVSAAFLATKRQVFDNFAVAAAELTVLYGAIAMVTGPLWARKAWGVWWVWDARLTSTLVLFLIFVGYLALRAFVDDAEQRARWSAAVGAIGAINVPIVYMSVKWWRTLHQPQSSPSTLDPAYTMGLRLNAIALLLVTIYFIRKRYEIARLERAVEHLAEAAAMGGK